MTAAWIAALPDLARQQQSVFAKTGGLHAAALFYDDHTLLVLCEDVGRHNAVDKVVGWALRNRVDAGRTVLLLSGRIGFELVQKAIMLGVPVIAAVGPNNSATSVRLNSLLPEQRRPSAHSTVRGACPGAAGS